MTDAPDGKRDFFISFTGADRRWARWLAHTLAEAGYRFWFQDQDFAGSIPRNIEKAHEQSNRTILLLSDAYAQSGYCRSGWEMRYQQDPGGEQDLLILFRVAPAAPPPSLRRCLRLDIATPDPYQLAAIVRAHLGETAASYAEALIAQFHERIKAGTASTDQLLNAVHLVIQGGAVGRDRLLQPYSPEPAGHCYHLLPLSHYCKRIAKVVPRRGPLQWYPLAGVLLQRRATGGSNGPTFSPTDHRREHRACPARSDNADDEPVLGRGQPQPAEGCSRGASLGPCLVLY